MGRIPPALGIDRARSLLLRLLLDSTASFSLPSPSRLLLHHSHCSGVHDVAHCIASFDHLQSCLTWLPRSHASTIKTTLVPRISLVSSTAVMLLMNFQLTMDQSPPMSISQMLLKVNAARALSPTPVLAFPLQELSSSMTSPAMARCQERQRTN